MKQGMMWLCDKGKSISENIELANKHLWEAHSQLGDYCEIALSDWSGDIEYPIETSGKPYILPGNIWIGSKS